MQEWKMQERQRMESRKKRKVGPIRYQQLEQSMSSKQRVGDLF